MEKDSVYKAKEREYKRLWARRWKKAHPEVKRVLSRAQQDRKNELQRKRLAECDDSKRSAIREYKRLWQARYRRRNLSEMRERERLYSATKWQKHPERERAKLAVYAAAHPEERLARTRNRRARLAQAPGSHTSADISRLYESQKGKCAACRAEMTKTGPGKYTVDHIRPIKPRDGGEPGSNDPANLQLLCKRCNQRKNNRTPEEWAAAQFVPLFQP